MSFENIIKDGNFYQASTGDYGFRILTGNAATPTSETSVVGESFRSIQALNSTVTVTATSVNGDNLSGQVIPKGGVILGKFTSITITDGTAIAYLAS
jgi:hypothetical protein